jgi:hypothetical protein
MKILFENSAEICVELNSSPVIPALQGMFKHLQHVDIPFRIWDNPYHVDTRPFEDLVHDLVAHARVLGITVSVDQCLDRRQSYLNDLHKIYEQNYNGDPAWLNFHEHIHMLENFKHDSEHNDFLIIDYREKSGMLQIPMHKDWIASTQTKVSAGDVFLHWAELGKTPYRYWLDGEPDQVARLCELAKPWLILRPKLFVALKDHDALDKKNLDQFENWWQLHKSAWCRHWNLDDWNLGHMLGCLVIGQVTDLSSTMDLLKQQVSPKRVLEF